VKQLARKQVNKQNIILADDMRMGNYEDVEIIWMKQGKWSFEGLSSSGINHPRRDQELDAK